MGTDSWKLYDQTASGRSVYKICFQNVGNIHIYIRLLIKEKTFGDNEINVMKFELSFRDC